jgi:hypothetical protein
VTTKELAKALRRAHRERYGGVSPRPDPEDADSAEAEDALGFPLPKLVRKVFALAGPDFVNPEFGVEKYTERYDPTKAPDDPGYWPRRMLPVKNLSGEIDWLCVECAAELPVYVFYDNWDSGGPCWPGLFELVAESFDEFLTHFTEFPPGRADPEDPDGRP